MAEPPDVLVRTASRRALADEWALVLEAEGLSPAVRPGENGYAVCVPSRQEERAEAVLSAYARENPRRPPETPPVLWEGRSPVLLATGVSAALLAFFLVTGPAAPGGAWFERGAADTARILSGEPWRCATALTLHADRGHALGNAVAGGVFLAFVFRALGPGLGAALVLAAAVLANALQAALQPSHVSVGASTAVFAAVGLLGGVARRQRLRARRRGPWAPVAASLALLAMLGMEGERTDFWGHAFGLGCGLALGLATAWRMRRPPGRVAQRALGAAALFGLLASWGCGLLLGPR